MLLTEIEVGVALDSVATPPATDKAKSLFSNAPLPPLVLNTASLMVTAIVELSLAIATEEMVGDNLSFRLIVLLLCVVLDAFPEPS